MSVRIVEFEPAHLEEIEVREPECVEKDLIKAMAEQTPTYSVLADKGVIFCFGIIPMWEGVAEIWSVTGKLVEKYPVSFHKASKYAIDSFWDFYQLKRLQATCQMKNDQSRKWLVRLGFKQEGVMENYGPNLGRYYMMARTK